MSTDDADKVSGFDRDNLPPFPVDEDTLARVEHAMGGAYKIEGGEHVLVGADYSLAQLLDFMSGYDPKDNVLVQGTPGGVGENIPVYEVPGVLYTERDILAALIAEVRALREQVPVVTSPDTGQASDGHLFRIAMASRGVLGWIGENGGMEHTESDWWSPTTAVEVRAFDLPTALGKAAALPLSAWFPDEAIDNPEGDPPA